MASVVRPAPALDPLPARPGSGLHILRSPQPLLGGGQCELSALHVLLRHRDRRLAPRYGVGQFSARHSQPRRVDIRLTDRKSTVHAETVERYSGP
jgi:hypothetical protein